MEIDPRFREAKAAAESRRTGRRRRQLGVVLLPLLLLTGGGGLALWLALPPGSEREPEEAAEPMLAADQPPAFASSFIDIAGDPMVLRLGEIGGAPSALRLGRPPELPAARGMGQPQLIRDRLIAREERLMTTLPSSREDFAFFQAQRSEALSNAAPAIPSTGEGLEEGSWGAGIEGVTEEPEAQMPVPTLIENTTSAVNILPEIRRRPLIRDETLRVTQEQPLAELIEAQGAPAEAARAFAAEVQSLNPELASIGPGHVIALRLFALSEEPQPVQLSIYAREKFVGSFALEESTRIGPAADPWVRDDLFRLADHTEASAATAPPKHRLLDALYSAALRNGMPQALVGEAMVMMSRAFDLESFALPDDEMQLIWLPLPGPGKSGVDGGQILYISLIGRGRSAQECLVLPRPGGPGFDCQLPQGAGQGHGIGSLRAGLIVPVKGVVTSGFGPRHHPVLKVTRLHAGTDWAAPTGTPIHAAADGKVNFAGTSGGYGNLVRIDHGKGLETRYAHLNAFAEGMAADMAVKAGQLIGYVGTTGLSTGPHLHFEVFQNATAVDAFGGGGTAVEQLVEQIIRVESGGRAEAQNAMSSATGLGQFIDGTWLRMMKSYRPDLASTLTPADQLALRKDPTLSREMVGHYARETEAFLRARKHEITPGRLYLGHFLGPQGAHQVLSAEDAASLETLFPAEVIRANSAVMAGKTAAALKGWADAKMQGGGAAPAPARLSSEALAWKRMIDAMLASAGP